jgi:uncharacterized membrane protein YphA (DoxX/SURF4 family)
MKDASGIAQLILRIALGMGFLLPVADRLGFLGPPGANGVSWGDWDHFILYSHTLMPFLNSTFTHIASAIATAGEMIFGIGLIVGFKTKQMAFGAAMLTLTFGLFMAVSLGISAPFNYPVFVFTGAGLVLSAVGRYKWSIDDLISRKRG